MKANRSEVLEVTFSKTSEYDLCYLMKSTRGYRKLSWEITKHARKRISQRVRNYQAR